MYLLSSIRTDANSQDDYLSKNTIENTPKITEICWNYFDQYGEVYESHYHMIDTYNKSEVLYKFYQDILKSKKLVFYNLNYDLDIINIEFKRLNIKPISIPYILSLIHISEPTRRS